MNLTSKERVKLSLSWKDADRLPHNLYTTPEIDQKLKEYFKGRDYRDVFGVDFKGIWPDYRGEESIKAENGIRYDIWGTGYRTVKNEFGSYEEAVYHPLAELKTMDDVAKYPWPDINANDYSTMEAQCDKVKDFAICFGGEGVPGILNYISDARGRELVLMDIISGDEVGTAIIDKRVDYYYEFVKRGLEAAKGKIDIMWFGDDLCTQTGMLFPPEVFDSFFRPRLKKFYDLAHEHGAKAMMHCCGDTHELMPKFIDMGLDVLDSMQPEPKGMEPEKIRKLCKGKLAFCGLISTQVTLPRGTVEECRKEARHRIDVIGKGGGYFFCTSHCIQPDTPLENIIAVYEESFGHKIT